MGQYRYEADDTVRRMFKVPWILVFTVAFLFPVVGVLLSLTALFMKRVLWSQILWTAIIGWAFWFFLTGLLGI